MRALKNNLFSKWAVDKISLGTPGLKDDNEMVTIYRLR